MGIFIYRSLIWRFPPSSHDLLLSLPVSSCLPLFCLRNNSRPNRHLVFCLGALSPRDRSRRIPLSRFCYCTDCITIMIVLNCSYFILPGKRNVNIQQQVINIKPLKVQDNVFLFHSFWRSHCEHSTANPFPHF